MKTKLFLILITACFFSDSVSAALKLDSSGKNPNFLYEYDPKALASTIQFIVRTGSVNDPKTKQGLVNFSFLSLLRGTKEKSRAEFLKAVETIGASIDTNTGYTHTDISLNVISENLEQSIHLLAEAVLKPALRKAELESLRDELMAKLQQEKSNNRMLLRRAYRLALYKDSSLAFPPNGTILGVKESSLDDVNNTLSTYLKSKNILIAVTSNQKEEVVKNWLEQSFQNLAEGDAPIASYPERKKVGGRKLYIVSRKGSSTTEMNIGHYGISADHPLRDEIDAGMFIFGSNFNSRLMRVLRKENGWTYGAYAYFQINDIGKKNEGLFAMYSFPQKEFSLKAAAKAVEMYEDYVKNGITKKELLFAKNSMSNSYPFQFANAKARMGAKLAQALDGAPFLSVPAYQKKIRNLNGKKIHTAIKKVHDPKNLIFVAVGDEDQLKDLAKTIPGITEVKVIHETMSDKEF